MIPNKHHTTVIQGMTGKQGTFWSERMLEYGTNIIAGVNPKRAGETHLSKPIHASVKEVAREYTQIDCSVMFIPPLAAKAAAIDACEAGVRLLVCLTEHIPAQDVMEIHAAARANGTQIVGPNTAGIVTPGQCFLGIMPAFNKQVFRAGEVAVISRSGSLGTLISFYITRAGMGQSVFYGIGGDPMIGTNTKAAVEIINADPSTKAIVICGEIGGSAEEQAAEYVAAQVQKPVVAFIAGRRSPAGKKMGHAGAIIADGKGDYDSKRSALEAAGIRVVDVPSQVVDALQASK